MNIYSITNRTSGLYLGTYCAANAYDAVDAMCREAGYSDHCEATAELNSGDLCDYATGKRLREATDAEYLASLRAARLDGGAGTITVDGNRCYICGPGEMDDLIITIEDLDESDPCYGCQAWGDEAKCQARKQQRGPSDCYQPAPVALEDDPNSHCYKER